MDRPLTRDEFEIMYRYYMSSNGYHFEQWEVDHDWRRYARGRSWFLYTFHGEHAFAVGQMLENRGQ